MGILDPGNRRRVRRRTSRNHRVAPPTPLIVAIIGRTATVLALVGVASFGTTMVALVVAGAGQGHSVDMASPEGSVIGVGLLVFGGSVLLWLLLTLLNTIDIKPWFDPATAVWVRPSRASEWAIRIGGLVAGMMLPLTVSAVGVGVAVLSMTRVDPDDWAGPLITIMLAGVLGSILVAGVAGGIAVMGWFGVVAGLLLGAGLLGVVAGPMSDVPAGTLLGVIAIGLSVACYYAGGRFRGTMPASVGSFAASGMFALLGVAFFVLAALTEQIAFLVAGVAATVGYLIGALLGRRNSTQATPGES